MLLLILLLAIVGDTVLIMCGVLLLLRMIPHGGVAFIVVGMLRMVSWCLWAVHNYRQHRASDNGGKVIKFPLKMRGLDDRGA
jgi:hypothetical protein